MNAPNGVLLSHRLRGFDRNDATLAGLKNALARNVAHIEFDVRLTADGKFLVLHDPFATACDGGRLAIGHHTCDEIRRQAAQPDLALLDDMLATVCGSTNDPGVIVYIDIKDAGGEETLLQLVNRLDLSHRVVYVSWIARSLFEIHRLDPAARLCFSHWTFFRFPFLFRLSSVAAIAACRIAKVMPVSNLSTFLLFPEPDSDPNGEMPETLWRGYNHAHLLRRGVSGAMARALRDSGGMICIPTQCASRRLVETMHAQGIEVAVFAATTPDETAAIRTNIGPDIVFCDDAEQF